MSKEEFIAHTLVKLSMVKLLEFHTNRAKELWTAELEEAEVEECKKIIKNQPEEVERTIKLYCEDY